MDLPDLFEVIRFGRRAAIECRVHESCHNNSDDPLIAGGQCYFVSEMVQDRYGYDMVTGCYHGTDVRRGQPGHVYHVWTWLDNGLLLDLTADQFGDPTGWRIVPITDPRYVVDCPHEGTTG
jgi:hypothetical protein